MMNDVKFKVKYKIEDIDIFEQLREALEGFGFEEIDVLRGTKFMMSTFSVKPFDILSNAKKVTDIDIPEVSLHIDHQHEMVTITRKE